MARRTVAVFAVLYACLFLCPDGSATCRRKLGRYRVRFLALSCACASWAVHRQRNADRLGRAFLLFDMDDLDAGVADMLLRICGPKRAAGELQYVRVDLRRGHVPNQCADRTIGGIDAAGAGPRTTAADDAG